MEGLTAPWPYLGVFPRVSPPSWECICARGDFLGVNSCPQTSSHSLWERVYLPLVPCTWLPLGVTLLMSRNYPKGLSGATWALHESDCSPLALVLWPWSHLSLPFIATPGWHLMLTLTSTLTLTLTLSTPGYGTVQLQILLRQTTSLLHIDKIHR